MSRTVHAHYASCYQTSESRSLLGLSSFRSSGRYDLASRISLNFLSLEASSLAAFSFATSCSLRSVGGSHLLFKILRTASGLILNFSARISVVKVSGSSLCSCLSPCMASREILRGGCQPSGNCFFMASRWARHSAGVDFWEGARIWTGAVPERVPWTASLSSERSTGVLSSSRIDLAGRRMGVLVVE
jgi:hypothetical protein